MVFIRINCFWIINNSTEVLDRLHQINKTSRAIIFDSYDFATLYTNIPHNALKNNIRSLVCEAFKKKNYFKFFYDNFMQMQWMHNSTGANLKCTLRLLLFNITGNTT